MPFRFDKDTMYLRHSLKSHCNLTMPPDQQLLQFLDLQLGNASDLICLSSHQILQRSPSTLFADTLFSFHLRDLKTPPLVSKFLLVRYLTSFNLPIAFSNFIFDKIVAFAHDLTAGNLDLNFHIIASLDFVEAIWIDLDPPTPFDYSPSYTAAPVSAIRRVMDLKFDGLGGDEHGDCTVCCDELDEDCGEKEVTRIPCGHVFHKSCIVHWLLTSNSCPLCRTKLEG